MRRFIILCLLGTILFVGCRQVSPRSEGAAVAIPTAGHHQQAASDLEAAGAVASRFLDAWQLGDFAAMHNLLTYRNRELTSFAEFRALYQNTQNTMALKSLEYRPLSLTGEGRILSFQYEITFKSRILGAFSDPDRLLQLVIDPQVDGWRIAWSPADIFAEMGRGARLVFEEQVPSRANIYDRDGKVLADQNSRVVRILVDNRRIPQRETCFRSLSEATGRSLSNGPCSRPVASSITVQLGSQIGMPRK